MTGLSVADVTPLTPSSSRENLDKMTNGMQGLTGATPPHNIVSFFQRARHFSAERSPLGRSYSWAPKMGSGRVHVPGERRAKIRTAVIKTGQAVQSRVQRQVEAALGKAKVRAQKVSTLLAKPENVVARDKMGFTAGIALLIFTEYIFLCHLEWIKAWYTAVVIPLYGIRYVIYHADKTHYFLIDFCYVINLLLLFTLHFYPNSTVLFKATFALASGPVPVAIIAWRNSLVFHSLDKVTSVVIHLLPCGIVFCMRWFPERTTHNELKPSQYAGLFDLFVRPFCVYVYWQTAYFLKTQVVDRRRMQNRPDLWTSARWLSRHRTSKGLAHKLINKDGTGELSINISLIKIQIQYTALTLIPVLVIYHSYVLHCLYLIIICLWCVHNGAGYYFEVFSKKYIEEVMMKDHHREVSMAEAARSRISITSDEGLEYVSAASSPVQTLSRANSGDNLSPNDKQSSFHFLLDNNCVPPSFEKLVNGPSPKSSNARAMVRATSPVSAERFSPDRFSPTMRSTPVALSLGGRSGRSPDNNGYMSEPPDCMLAYDSLEVGGGAR
eukprot:CAMPEP_0173450114 /NCGR_PEP_ID=MMETSP1357-20121228/44074_1 /TAXON_ID=77926 /ORGANISM="Hemiselmis rufescens, Strain PCC563" /LENGTH=552 /DNA_ID=CAMNT_0014416765 /DNA_START=162 /DNA_END=1820 /DNA_ORIENTATION=+